MAGMKRWVALALAVAGAPAVAGLLVTEVAGKVAIEGVGTVATLAEIPEGARLTVPAGARVVLVHLRNGREFRLADGGRYRVTADGIETAAGRAVAAVPLPAGDLPAVRVVTSRVAQAAVVMKEVGRPGLRDILEEESWLTSPVDTAVVTLTPPFAWRAVPGADRYTLTLAAEGGATLWAGSTAATQAPLPGDIRLSPGSRYVWKVEAAAAGKPLAAAEAAFSTASAEAMERLARLRPAADAPFARRVLYAAQLREAGAVEEARRAFAALARERPDDEVLRQQARR